MSSTVLKWSIAVLILSGAVLLWLSLQLASRQPDVEETQTTDEVAEGAEHKAVIAVSPIEADSAIEASDVSLEPVSVVPANGFETPQRVIGRTSASSVGVGEPIVKRHFRGGGVMASEVPDGMRALAVSVNDVSGVAGFVEPGDRVDLVLFLPEGNEVQGSQARVLLRDVAVLAFGEDSVATTTPDDNTSPNPGAGTAVLAVPEDAVSRVLLGASTGRISLALRQGKTADLIVPETDSGEDGEPGEDGDPVNMSRLTQETEDRETLRNLSGQRPQEPAPRTRIHRGGETEEIIH
ncbi:MAG: Flp pilus assembly protein CpaB [Pseudomonadota bacterium]